MVKLKKDKWMKLRTDMFMSKRFDGLFKSTRDGRTRREWSLDKAFDDWLWRDDEVFKPWIKKNLRKLM